MLGSELSEGSVTNSSKNNIDLKKKKKKKTKKKKI